MPEPLTYSVPEAATLLGISQWSMYEAIKKNELPHRKIGRRIVIPKIQLEAWLAGQDSAA